MGGKKLGIAELVKCGHVHTVIRVRGKAVEHVGHILQQGVNKVKFCIVDVKHRRRALKEVSNRCVCREAMSPSNDACSRKLTTKTETLSADGRFIVLQLA